MSPLLLKKNVIIDRKKNKQKKPRLGHVHCAMSTVKLSWQEIGLSIDVRSAVGVDVKYMVTAV